LAAPDAQPTIPDAGTAPDAAAPDAAPPPARHLVDVKLFGDLPLDNVVLDPQFDLHAGNWLAIGNFTGQPRGVRLLNQEYGLTPVGMPAVVLQNRAQDPTDTIVLGSVMAAKGPMTASVWIGRHLGDAASLLKAKPSVIATLASGSEQAYDLVPETITSSRTLDQIVWQKYSAMIADTPVGIMTFAFQDPADKPMLATGPVVRSMVADELPGGALHLEGRPLTTNETRAMRELAKWRQRQIGARTPKAATRPEALRRFKLR
jgi:hypothetical protein